MPDEHQTLTVDQARDNLHDLHERIVRNWDRIELTTDRADQTCVIISKAELDCLERALHILHETPSGQGMHSELHDLIHRCGPTATRMQSTFNIPIDSEISEAERAAV